MAIADDNRARFRAIAASARGIPGLIGLRPYSVAIVTDNWGDDHVGENGSSFQSNRVPITEQGGQPPKVEFDDEDDLTKGICTIGPITPPYSGGGIALATLQRRVLSGQEAYVFLTGPKYPSGARFAVREVRTAKALHWTLICEESDFQPE